MKLLLDTHGFNRILVVQARRGGFHLVSGDAEIGRYDVPVLW